ncbi:MAG: AAA family ATPase [Desulfobacterales bacterium]|nr:AAA family ATPase [Desulfobacterales bacterium]
MNSFQLNFQPFTLSEYIGNDRIKTIVSISLNACKLKKSVMNHTLITGERGTGKTTLGRLIAKELNMSFKIISADAIMKLSDLTNLFLINLPNFLIIDEIHNLKSNISDAMHEAMDTFQYSFVDKDGLFQTESLHPFCIIGMTTDPGLLTSPMYSRFPKKYHLLPYTVLNLQRIIMQASKNNKIDIDATSAYKISLRSNGIPRIALSHFSNVYEYALKYNSGMINDKMVSDCFSLYGIDTKGLDEVQIEILKILAKSKKPMGAENLCQSAGIGVEALLRIYEPPLLSAGFMIRSPGGREITKNGLKHLNSRRHFFPK